MGIGREGVEDAGIRIGRHLHIQIRPNAQTGIGVDIGGDCDFFLIVVEAVTTAEHEFAIESSWTPGKTDLGPEVIFLCVPGISLGNGQSSQIVSPRTWVGDIHVVSFVIERAKVGPAQT